jgi:septal ring factor EnvC (AmiA/AmiB activator)
MIAFWRENRYDIWVRKVLVWNILLWAALPFFLLFLFCPPGYAKKNVPLHQRIDQAQGKLKAIEQRIRENEGKIKKAQTGEKETLRKIEIVDQLVEGYKYKRRVLDDKISINRTKQKSLNQEMSQLEESLSRQKSLLALRMRSLYKAGPLRFWQVVLGAESFMEFFQNASYMKLIAQEDSRSIRRFSLQWEDLRVKKEKMRLYHVELEDLQRGVAEQEMELVKNKKEKETHLNALRNEEREYALVHRELSDSLNEIQALLTDLEKNRRLQYNTSPSSGFLARKGSLSWPVQGKVISRSVLGKRDAEVAQAAGNSVLNKGIVIRAPVGSEIYSIYAGKVVYADWCLGYGKLLIVDHGGGYCSIYAHASELVAGCGDFVRERQIIARVGDTGTVRESQLYFEIRYQGNAVDPLKWLK